MLRRNACLGNEPRRELRNSTHAGRRTGRHLHRRNLASGNRFRWALNLGHELRLKHRYAGRLYHRRTHRHIASRKQSTWTLLRWNRGMGRKQNEQQPASAVIHRRNLSSPRQYAVGLGEGRPTSKRSLEKVSEHGGRHPRKRIVPSRYETYHRHCRADGTI